MIGPAGATVWSAPDAALPLVVRATDVPRLDDWAVMHRDWIDDTLTSCGAILFRGFGVRSVDAFRAAASAMCDELVEYTYPSTPRTAVDRTVYTATDAPRRVSIALHNENSHLRQWPMRLFFYCHEPASSGGRTPLARTRTLTRRIDPAVCELFAARRLMYVRNYQPERSSSWQNVFQTNLAADVERICRNASMSWVWLPNGGLRTMQLAEAMACHPRTSERLWFNQAHVFHPSNPRMARASQLLGAGADLPMTVLFGDETPIPDELLVSVHRAHADETVTFAWQRGDVLAVDNMLVLHGREPYEGRRQVFVAMGDLLSPCGRATTV